MRWIRPAGVIGFVALMVLVMGIWWLLSGWLLKLSIESVGTRLVGAKVELDSAGLSLSPLGFHLHRLQVTDPEKPMQNMVEVASADGTVETWKLLLGHVIIDTMSADGIRFNTPRKTSGALPKAQPAGPAQPQGGGTNPLEAVKKKLPSADEILQRAKLLTSQRISELKDSEKTQRERVDKAVKSLPEESRLKEYKRRVDEITGGKVQSLNDLQQRRDQLKKLQDQIRQDKSAVENAAKDIADAKQVLTAKFKAAREAPQQDLARLSNEYGFNTAGASNVTRLLFGDRAQQWFDLIRTWYGRIVRILPSGPSTPQPARPPRGTGHYVHFHEEHPLPDFLIRQANASAVAPIGDIDAKLQDITPQPQILGRPARLDASGRNLHNVKTARVTGVFNHVDPDHPNDSVDWKISGWSLTDARVTKSDALSLTLARATADITGSAGFSDGSLNASGTAAFHGAQWRSQAHQDWAGQLASALAAIKSFDVGARMHGSLGAPSLSLQSNLDEQIKNAVVKKIKTRGGELAQKLQAKLTARVDQAAGPYNKTLATVTDGQGTTQSRLNQINDLLKAQVQSAVKQQENKAKKQLEKNLKKGFGF